MSNEQNPKEAVSQEEMDVIAQAALAKATAVPIINTDAVQNELPIPGDSNAAKITVNPEPVRLPTAEDLQGVDRSKLEKAGTEVLHEEVKVGQPDYSYKPPADAPKDDAPTVDITSGLVIEKKQDDDETKAIVGLSEASTESIDAYMAQMEADMAESSELRADMAAVNPNLQPNQEQFERMVEASTEEGIEKLRTSDTEVESERARKYKEAVVVIDKLESKNLNFTKEERAKLESADVIKINEVKKVDLKTIRRRREKRTDVHKAIQRRGNSMRHTNVILPASGYYAEMLGCAPYEIMTLQNDDDPLTDSQVKWTLVYEKMKWNSIGITSFEEFMEHTAIADYETFVWGILRSTFEDIDKVSLNCMNEKCKVKGKPYSYEHRYSVAGLLRAEDIDERLNQSIARVVDARTLEDARAAHEIAPVNDILAIELPESGFVAEIGISTVNDFLTKTLEHLSDENLEPQYRQAALIATALKGIAILDETDGQYDYFDDQAELTEIIYQLSANDLVVLAHKVEEHTENVSFNYGFIDLECPKCRAKTEYQPMDVASILFYRNALSMNVSVE